MGSINICKPLSTFHHPAPFLNLRNVKFTNKDIWNTKNGTWAPVFLARSRSGNRIRLLLSIYISCMYCTSVCQSRAVTRRQINSLDTSLSASFVTFHLFAMPPLIFALKVMLLNFKNRCRTTSPSSGTPSPTCPWSSRLSMGCGPLTSTNLKRG